MSLELLVLAVVVLLLVIALIKLLLQWLVRVLTIGGVYRMVYAHRFE